MRILHLVYSSSYEIGGAEVFSIDAIRALHEKGVEQFVLCRKQAHIFERLRQVGIPDEKPVVLMLARINSQKGVDILLRAAVELDVFLLLAGDGSGMENYQKLARDLGIESRVRFIGWRNDRSALLGLADVVALPSRSEAFGTVMAEAWYKGVPVVASRADGPRQYIEHGMNGMLSDIEDVEGLAKNLRAVIEDDSLRKRLVAGGMRTYDSQFSKEVVISNLLQTYEEVICRGVIRNQ